MKTRPTAIGSSYIRTRNANPKCCKRKRRLIPLTELSPNLPPEETDDLLDPDSGSNYNSDYNGEPEPEPNSEPKTNSKPEINSEPETNSEPEPEPEPEPNNNPQPTFEGAYGPHYPTYTSAAFSIFMTISGLSRTNFDMLLKILKHPEFRIVDLPSSYKICKRLQAGLPTLPMHTQRLPINKKLAYVTKDTSASAYYHSIGDIVHRILSTPSLRKDLYFGPGMKVANSIEFWHGSIWRESTLFGADSVCVNGIIYRHGDCVQYIDTVSAITALGRIRSIFKKSNTELLYVEIEPLLRFEDLPKQFQSAERRARSNEYWLDEQNTLDIDPIDLRRLVSLYIQGPQLGSPQPICMVHVTEILYSMPPSNTLRMRPSKYRHRLPAETYQPQSAPAGLKTLKVFLDIYVDDFGTFRSVYHSLGGVYVVIGNQPLELRQKLCNIHLIGFVPFGANFKDFIQPIVAELVKLERGVQWIIDGVPYWVIVGLGVNTSDLPQGNSLASVKNHNADYGCRGCFVPQWRLGDVDFDIIRNGRYQEMTTILLKQLRNLSTQSAQNSYAKTWGLALGQPHPLDLLAIDRHTQTPQDPAHALLQNLAKTLISGTLDVLNPTGKAFFLSELEQFIIPRKWHRFQNPVTHLKSYFFTDSARLIMIGPFLIDKLGVDHFSADLLEKMKNELEVIRRSQVIKEILGCWVAMASANAICFSSYINDYTRVDGALYNLGIVLIRVFPHLFKTRPSFHALQHLSEHARRFGTLRSISVSCKEMKHRIFKDAVRATNKKDMPRDLTTYESTIQAFRFIAAGWCSMRFPGAGNGMRSLVDSNIFRSFIQHSGELWKPRVDKNNLICDKDVVDIRLHGTKWSLSRSHQQGLPSPLTNPQMGELGDAYKEQGDATLQLVSNVSYFGGVSYMILVDDSWVKVTVRTGDVLEVLTEIDGQAFVRVLGIMLHGQSVFFVVKWLVPSGQHHPRFNLPEYTEEDLFTYAAFFSLKTVDHPRFVNQTIFYHLGYNKFIRNEWVFNAA